MFTVYTLNSLKHKFIYVGMTENLNDRLVRYNKGFVRSTKSFAPFELIYTENCETGQQAREREKILKSTSGKRFLKSLIEKPTGIVR
ncbi:MAG: GIY-YIG nuclease family protein [Ignavibacteriaceae bacterium]|nr:GIY-YIG nuclease family protein [Ignavibacteriaceae bacterium]